MAKVEYDSTDERLFRLTAEGRAYLEYNEKVGGEPFGDTVGMDVVDLSPYGGTKEGLYKECIRQGKTWEELLALNHQEWDVMPKAEE